MSDNDWISTKDRMPKVGESVLTVRRRRITGKAYVAMVILSCCGWTYQMQDETLYWQPLPELPKDLR